jgi:aspartate kinase
MAVTADVGDHLDELEAFYAGVRTMGEVTNRGMDSIASFGERMNVRTLSALLRHRGLQSQPVDATELIVTDDNFQSANPIMDLSRKKVQAVLKPMLKKGIIPIVTGFIGANKAGILTTLGRGGSDYTASILGVCLDADEVFTWTDVDGVMTADPRVVKGARVIPELSYNEVSEMAYFGAKVLHPKTIQPLVEREIPLWVKNTFNPEYPGTRIARNGNKSRGKVAAVSSIKDLSMVTVQGRGMLGVPGIAARTFSAVAREGASVLMISQSSSEQSICFVIPTANAAGVVKMLEQELALELERRDIDRVWQQPEVVIVTVIGAGLRNVPGVSAKVFGALGESNVNIIAIAQGSSEYSISMVIPAKDADLAVQQIHKKVVLNGG